MQQFDSCPRCGANTEAEAEKKCCGADDCPMGCAEDWNEALHQINMQAQMIDELSREYEKEARDEEDRLRLWRNPTDDMLRDAGLLLGFVPILSFFCP